MVKTAKPVQQADYEKAAASVPVMGTPIDYFQACILAMAPDTKQAILDHANRLVCQNCGNQNWYQAGRYYKDIEARNASIKADYWQKGERIPLLERRYGISKARLWQIIKS